MEDKVLCVYARCLQLFSYSNISPVSAMSVSGVISPTNLSLFTSPVTTPRTTPRSTPVPRWNVPFISLDEDYNMITPLMSGNGNNPEASAGALMDDGMSVICVMYPVTNLVILLLVAVLRLYIIHPYSREVCGLISLTYTLVDYNTKFLFINRTILQYGGTHQ